MKNYTITVNGTAYDVTVEENGQGMAAPAAMQTAVPKTAAPKAAPKASAGAQGKVKITAPMPGKIVGIKANAGQSVKKGDVVLVLEAMKMENEIVAPSDGTVAGVSVAVGDMVESGDVLASLN